MRKKSNEFQRGNALFMILLAVALFAALSYAVTQSQGGSGAQMGAEQNSVLASDIMEYAKTLERGVNIILQNGYSENQISFAHDDLTGYGTYGDSPQTEVFNPQGGGVTYRTFSRATSDDWIFNGRTVVDMVGSFESWGDCDASCADLIAYLPNIPRDLCMKINQNLGIENPSGDPPQDGSGANTAKFDGTFAKNNLLRDGSPFALSGEPTGCFEGGGSPAAGTYHFYHVLLAR